MRRFLVSEMSMAPALMPGDWILAGRLRHPSRGDIAVFQHPHREDFWLVKRIVAIAGDTVTVDGLQRRIPPGHVWLLSDATHRTRADSRTFGALPIEGMYVAWVRYRKAPA